MPETTNKRKTKKCPFCAETILAAAVKCRYCAEFLYPEDHPAMEGIYDSDEIDEEEYEEGYEDEEQYEDDDVLFRVSPSVFAAVGTFVKTVIMIALAYGLFKLPIEEYISKLADSRFEFTKDQYIMVEDYRILAAIAVAAISVLIFVLKIIILKSTAYEISEDRIEWERGIFNRKIDNLDMFRVTDIKLHRSILDCLVGIGTVTLLTKDQTDPEFDLYKVRHPRRIFNILKRTSLEADSKQGVIHLE